MENKTADIIREALMEYELCNMHILGDEDSNLPLVDLLTPEGESDITWGKEHIDRITDLIMEKLGDAASQQCAELKTSLDLQIKKNIQDLENANEIMMDYREMCGENEKLRNANAILGNGYHTLQSENESLKKRVSEIIEALKLAVPYVDDAQVIKRIKQAIKFPINPLS